MNSFIYVMLGLLGLLPLSSSGMQGLPIFRSTMIAKVQNYYDRFLLNANVENLDELNGSDIVGQTILSTALGYALPRNEITPQFVGWLIKNGANIFHVSGWGRVLDDIIKMVDPVFVQDGMEKQWDTQEGRDLLPHALNYIVDHCITSYKASTGEFIPRYALWFSALLEKQKGFTIHNGDDCKGCRINKDILKRCTEHGVVSLVKIILESKYCIHEWLIEEEGVKWVQDLTQQFSQQNSTTQASCRQDCLARVQRWQNQRKIEIVMQEVMKDKTLFLSHLVPDLRLPLLRYIKKNMDLL